MLTPKDLPHLDKIVDTLSHKRPCQIAGIWGSGYLYILSALYSKIKPGMSLLVTPGVEEAEAAREDWHTFFPEGLVYYFPAEPDQAGQQARLETVISLIETPLKSPLTVIAPVQALWQDLPNPSLLKSNGIILRINQVLKRDSFIQKLVDTGFRRIDQVELPGEFSIRGGIVDIFAYHQAKPIRLELVGDVIESIREFNPEDQVSEGKLDSVLVYLFNPAKGSKDKTILLEYIPPEALVILKEPELIKERINNYLSNTESTDLSTPGHLTKKLTQYPVLSFHTLPLSEKDETTFNFQITSVQRFSSGLSNVIKELSSLYAAGRRLTIYCQGPAEITRLKEILAGTDLENAPYVTIKKGTLSAGFQFPEIQEVFISYNELFHRYRIPRRFREVPEARPIETFLELEKGDFVVHDLHGIGRYSGIETIERDDFIQECLVIEYQDRARVYTPVYQINEVQKYVGGRDSRPELSRLGSGLWEVRRERVRHAVNRLALELLEIQAIRSKENGITFPPDTNWQKDFEASFPYDDTLDQIKVTETIKTDMVRPRPMDRLICGDVGYGKTELSMRAAFKTATAGYQVAVLVPTTILAQQHYQNFTERMADYPINIEMLSRFRARPFQSEIIKKIKNGQVDIIIGTHRLLQSDVQFKNLGLIIIDEEQRFGVEHKERLKRLRATVDILTLTATPIPRTLHMTLLGIRDISTLATPPQDRRAIQTQVNRFAPELIRQAVLRELNRDGQVYFVHNRIYDIQVIAEKLQRLVPEASFGIAHGQMPSDELEQRMKRFVEGGIDVLVSTNIVESGLDIPRVNTIFVNNAHLFGLADLHQLRGRVGRYKHQAFAYFLIPPNEPILPDAAKRLKAIQEFNELGAGFKIAMRDMEIRGVGNILGSEQSGHIATIGYELYCRLLENAIRQVKNQPVKPAWEVEIKLKIPAFLPVEYIPSEKHRLEIYRKIGRVTDGKTFEAVKQELEDRFGKPIPNEVMNLLELAQVKSLAQGYGITRLIQSTSENVIIATYLNHSQVAEIKRHSPKTIRIIDEKTLYILLPRNKFSEGVRMSRCPPMLRYGGLRIQRHRSPSGPSDRVPTDSVKLLAFLKSIF